MLKFIKMARLCSAVVGILCGGAALASNISLGDLTNDPLVAEATAPTLGGVTTPNPLSVLIDGDGMTSGIQYTLNYDTVNFDIISPDPDCVVNDAAGTILINYNSLDGFGAPQVIPAGTTNICDLTVTAVAGAPLGLSTVSFTPAAGGGCYDTAGGDLAAGTCVAFDAQIDVVAGPVLAPEIDVTPNPVNFNGGVGVNIDQGVTISNATGTDVLNVTALNLGGAAIYSLVGAPALPFNIAAGASQNITVRCNNPAAAAMVAGTLTVANNDSDEPNVVVNLSCTTNAAPIVATVNPTTINMVGPANTLVNGATTVGNSAASGGSLDVTGCAISPGFAIDAPPGDFSVNPGFAQLVTVSCTTPADGAPALVGTLTCGTNAASINGVNVGANPNLVVDLSCSSAVARPVPVVGSMGKILLASLVIGLGLLGMGLRRQA